MAAALTKLLVICAAAMICGCSGRKANLMISMP